MANKNRGEIDIILDRRRTLKLNTNAVCAFESVMGKPWDYYMVLLGNIYQDMRMTEDERDLKGLATIGPLAIRAILWAALLHDDKVLTIEAAGDLIEFAEGDGDVSKRRTVFNKILLAWGATLPEEAKKKVNQIAEKLDGSIDRSTGEVFSSLPRDGELISGISGK